MNKKGHPSRLPGIKRIPYYSMRYRGDACLAGQQALCSSSRASGKYDPDAALAINSHYGAMKDFNRNSGNARGADQIIFNIRKNEY
jgi:hypothetical protein